MVTEDSAGTLSASLDELAHAIRSGSVAAGVEGLVDSLDHHRLQVSAEEWPSIVRSVVRVHPVFGLIHESPFSRRAFEKPRGYAGDAETLDLVYRALALPTDATPLGRHIGECELESSTCRGIRSRLHILTAAIDRVADERPGARILSVACGHLREVQRSKAVAAGRVATVIAFDQDADSLRRVAYEQPSATPTQGSARQLVSGAARWSGLDLIYSTGLYDYLSDRFASALTRALFEMLSSGGRLLIANLTPKAGAGYLEACMDWWMTYRDEDGISRLADAISVEQIASARRFRDDTRNVVFLELTRA